jgi:hypothetical protein
MTAYALLIRPTQNGWAVYLSNGQELARYRGLCSKHLALRYLQRYTRSASTPRQPAGSWWRHQTHWW